MNDNLKYIDQIVRNRVINIAVESNNSGWEQLQQRLGNNPTKSIIRNPLIYTFLVVVLAVSGVLGSYLFITNYANNRTHNQATLNRNIPINVAPSEILTTQTTKTELKVPENIVERKSKSTVSKTNKIVAQNQVSGNDNTVKLDNTVVAKTDTNPVNITGVVNNETDTLSDGAESEPPMPVSDRSSSTKGCLPLTVNFAAATKNATAYFWEFGNGDYSTLENPRYTYNYSGKFFAKLMAKAHNGEDVLVRTDTIIVFDVPVVDFKSLHNAVITNTPIQFLNLSSNAVTYLWKFGDGIVSTDDNPLHQYKKQGKYNVSLYAWNENNCVDSMIYTNIVEARTNYFLVFPNAFSPDANGPKGGYYSIPDKDNSVFHPVHYGIAEYKLVIYDRFGYEIYESNDINIGWDGYCNANFQNSGVYIWKASGKYLDGQRFEKTGNVTLLQKK